MKKIFGFAAVVAMVAAANVKMASNNNEELTALQLENIEAMAVDWEHFGCPNGCLLDLGGCYCYRIWPYKEAIRR